MGNPKNLKDLHSALVRDGIIDLSYKEVQDIISGNGKESRQDRQDFYNIATAGRYFNGSYADFQNQILRPSMVKSADVSKEEKLAAQKHRKEVTDKRKQQVRQATGRQQPAAPATQQKPAPVQQKPAPVQQPAAPKPQKNDSVLSQYIPEQTPQKNDSVLNQYTSSLPSKGEPYNGADQGTYTLATDAQIMRDNTISEQQKRRLINENRRLRGEPERTFNETPLEQTMNNMGLGKRQADTEEGFTDRWEKYHQAMNTSVPFLYDTNGDGEADAYEENYVNKTPRMIEDDYIKQIRDEINYYNTKQDQGGGGTTRIEDAINEAYAKVEEEYNRRHSGDSFWEKFARMQQMSSFSGAERDAIEQDILKEKYAGVDAVAEAAYQAFPDEIKAKYGEDVVRNAIYQATFATMQSNATPKNFGQYLVQQLTNTVPGLLHKAAVRHASGNQVTLSDIADMQAAEYAKQFDNEGLLGYAKMAAGEVLPIVADPTMYIPFGGPAAKAVTTGIGKVAARQAIGRGLESGAVRLASKAAGSKLVSRGLSGAASTAAQMAAYEEAVGLANMANGSGQNFWEVTGDALIGGAKMAPIGFIGPGARAVKGRAATAIADKGLSKTAQWFANTGAKAGISTTAFIAEAGVFAAPDLIGLAVNGTYTNEQAKDIAIHSIATLAGFKVAGMFNPAHLEQTSAMVKSMVSGTMGTELAINRHDIEALKRLGYPEIKGDNIMGLFMPLEERAQATEGYDYFSYYSQIVLDERVPWSTRAKLIYIATGALPETGVRPNKVKTTTDEDGNIVVTTLQGNNPISQRFFSSKHKASAESYYRKASHDVERMQYEGVKQDIRNEYLGGMFKSQLVNDALAKDQKARTPDEQKLVDDYNHAVWVAEDLMGGYARRAVMLDDKLPDPEKALKKPEWERSEKEQQAVERYGERLNETLHNILRDNYADIAADLAWRDANEAAKEMSNKQDGKLYQCQLRGEEGVWYTVVDFDGTIEQGETGMDVTPGTNGDKMMVRNMATGETKMVTLSELTTLSTDRYVEVRNSLSETMYNNYTEEFIRNRRNALAFGKQPQVAEEGERLTIVNGEVEPFTDIPTEYVVIDKDNKSGTYIVENKYHDRKLINGYDILQKITDAEQQKPTQNNPQVPPTGPQTPPPAAPAQEPPVQPQGEAPAMPEQGTTFKLKVGDEFVDAEVTGKDDTGIIVRYEQNGTFRTEHLTPEELAPRLEQQEAPAAPVTPPAPATNEGEGGTPAAPDNGIPEDENGNKIFHKAEPKAVEDYFKNEKGYDDRFILAIADKRIAEAQKDLSDAGAKREKAYADVDEQAMDEAIAAERDAQERLDWWNKFKEGYGKEEQPAGEQPPVVEGGGEPDIPHSEPMPARKSVPVAPARQEPTTPEEKAAAHAENVQRWNNAPKVYGHTVVITLPNGEMHRARYVLSTHDAATASHDALHGYMSTPGYPEDNGRNANDRDYTDKDNQVTTERIANDFNGLAFQNPPIVNTGSEAGHLLGGNGTKQAHDISITLGAEGKDGKYLDATDENIPTTGISRRAFRDFLQNVDGHPMVYLELVDEVPHDTATMKKFNDETMKSNNSAQSTLKIARLLTDSEIVDLDKALNLMKGDDLEDLMGKPTVASAVLKVLVDGGYIGQNQVAQYTEGNGTLSARGIELVRELIRGTILDERAIKALNMSTDKYSLADVKRRIDQLAVQLVHNASLGDFSLKNEISRAVEFIQQTYSAWNGKGSREAALRAALKLDGGDIDFEGMTEDEIASERIARILSQVLTSFRHNKDYKVQTSLKIDDAVAFFEEYERNVQKAMKDAKSPSDLWGKKETREDVLKFLLTLKKYKDLFLQKDNGPEQPEQGQGQPGETETPGGNGGGNQGDGRPSGTSGTGGEGGTGTGRGSGEGRPAEGEVPVTPPRPGTTGAPQGGGEPPKGEGRTKISDNPDDNFLVSVTSNGLRYEGTIQDWSRKATDIRAEEDGWGTNKHGLFYYKKALSGRGGDNITVWFKEMPTSKQMLKIEQLLKEENHITPLKQKLLDILRSNGDTAKQEPPKPEEPGKPAGESAGGPAASEPHQLTVDEINGLNLSQSTKENAIDYVNGDRGPRARSAYAKALNEWNRVNGKGNDEEPPKGGGGTTGSGGGKPSTPRDRGGKPAEPKPAEPKPEGEGPKNSGGIDKSGLERLKRFKGLFGNSEASESRRPAKEGDTVSDSSAERFVYETATPEQIDAVEEVVEVLADLGKQLVEQNGFRTQSELVDFMRQDKDISKALNEIGFDEEDKANLYNDMWGQRVSTPWEGERSRMRLSEYADELSKNDKPKQDDKPKQIVSPMEPTVKNVVYKPNSKGKTNESIIPASMVQAVKTALGKINGGDTDGFVMDKVGFKDKDELYDALNAEQIDGVALAISAIERGEGLILGDMTGIGKGRQLAAVIRYARKEGIRPVFVTEKPGLFKDMMRDLLDVGADTPNKPFRPLILASDSDADVIAADGSKVKRADAQAIEKLLSGDLDKLAKGYDALFVTYANINNAKPETFFKDQGVDMDEPTHDANTETREPSELTKKKLNLVAKWARGSIVVMDEAHNAAGVKSTQGVQWREIIDTTSGVNAKGVVMASATYAKTPKNYVLYALRTPIKEAHLSSKKLEEVFAKGGVPLQEWLAGQLTGESYIRRERDMTGVNFDYRICVDGYDVEHPENSTPEALEKVKAIRKSNDKAARIANTLLKLDNVAKTKIQEIRNCLCPSERSGMSPTAVRVLVKQGDGTYKEQTIDPKNYPNRLKVKSSSFSSRISQINAQLFMAEKAESAADAAIKALKEGELPMIVFENTFDSLMKDLPVDNDGVLGSTDYAQAFVRYLEGLGNFTVDLMQQNPATGAWEELKCRIDLTKDKDAGLDFVMAKDMIENEGVGLHVSPVDRIRERLEEAGYKVGELSGRKYSIQKLPDGRYHRIKRKTENPDKVTDDYNTGKIDVLLINASGSTGRSMHNKGVIEEDGTRVPGKTQSGEVMTDRIRHQIYVQNFNNETTMVQAMGRIDRTGQMDHGKYTFLMTPVPAETNILMRAQRKREQLKANTTAQQDRNSFDAVNASDFINKYGDEVVAEYLTANPEIRDAMRINENDVTENGKPKEGIAKKATMNAYTLTCEQQQEFYDKVQAEYDEYVKVLKENGDYDLETQVVDLQAETLAEHMFVRGSHESDSMFSQDTNIARCRVKIQKKPLKLEEIYKHISERTGTDDQYEWNAKLRSQFEKHFADMEAEVEKEYQDKTDPAELAKKLTKQSKIAAFKAAVDSELKRFQLDLLIPFFYDTDEVTQAQGTIDGKERPHAIVYDIKLGRTLGSSSIIFAVNDGRQKVAVRMNDARTLDYIMMLAKNHTEKFDRNEWNKAQADAYEDAYIITGNLIGAYHNDIAMRGRMIRYTDSEGNLHTGILMPRNFKTSDITVQRPISEMFNTLISYANEPRRTSNSELPKFANGNLEIEDTRHFDELRFIVKGNKEGELAFKLKDDPDLKTYRTSKNPLKFTVRGQNSIRKVLGILAGRYGVSASVAVDPAYFMTREERDEEAEARMFRVNENIEETTPSRGSLNYGMPYTVHVIKERRKNIDPNSDWFIDTISKLKSKGLYGAANYRRGMEGSKRVYDEFFFENKKMAEEFVRMVNDEPARPLSVDERVDAKEPEWEDVDRTQHTYQLSDSSYLTGEDIATTFGFRNVDTGHFRSDEVRDLYNAFMTMAMILNIHPKSISLGGNMDVQMLSAEAANKEFKEDGTTAQFQTSGKTNSYTGATQKKMQFRDWATSFPIAHEWLHALDNYFGTFGLKNEETGYYEQTRKASESADRPNRPWTARPEMRDAWVGLLRSLVDSGFFGRLENENFFKNTNFTDSKMRPKYWGKRTEMLARAFEPYLRKKITDSKDNLSLWASLYGESEDLSQRMRDMITQGNDNLHGEFDPTPKEQAVIDKAFDKFFETIREKRDPDTGRVIMYEQAKPGETMREATMRETRNLNRVLAKTGLANSVTVESERDFAEGVFASTGRPLRTLDGIVYGYTDNEGNIHLNAKYLNFETPIHEYGHLWSAWAKKNHGDLWQRGIELAKESDAFKKLKEESKKEGSVYNGMTDDQLADEVLADAIGKKGQDMYDPKDWTRTARVKHWLTQLWHRIGEALGFRKRMPNMAVGDMSFDDIIRTAAGDVLSGKRLKGAKGKGKVNFASKGSVPTFYSNAAKAVENVKQNKATAEQWKAMLTKAGGIKAGEDKWMGLSQWLDEHKGQTLTKEEVAQFVADNGIKMEEVEYAEGPSSTNKKNFFSFTCDLSSEMFDIEFRKGLDPEKAFADIIEKYGEGALDYIKLTEDGLIRPLEYIDEKEALEYFKQPTIENEVKEIDPIRLDYTTQGLENKREIAFVVPDVGPYQEGDDVHFGPENKGRQIMWVRFGETTDESGEPVLVIDEIQSNRHQDAREKGYFHPKAHQKLVEFREKLAKKYPNGYFAPSVTKEMVERMGGVASFDNASFLTDAERAEYIKLHDEAGNAAGVPEAPFEKNWQEVAMKRMLRLAAEGGYAKLAWTTGEQQADRYGLQKVLEDISSSDWEERNGENGKTILAYGKDGQLAIDAFVDSEGKILDNDSGYFIGENLRDVVGKDIAERLLQDGQQLIADDGLVAGGKGMKSFYDSILPQFMNKYGKRWGVKVGEVELNTPGKEIMHSVDITPEMRESVITEGQPLFQAHGNEQIDRYPNGEIKEVRNYDDDGNLRRLLRYDENRREIRHWEPRIGTDLTRDENGIMRGMSNGVELKPYNFRFQQVAEPVKQAISSADTSLNQVASGLRTAPLQPGTTNFDLGGGRFDKGTEYLAEKGVENVVFDPFNRDAEHNQKAFEIVKNGGFDSVTCNNVLNVIAEPEVRSNVILQAAKALKQGGTAYFTVYEGSGNGEGKETSKGWQNNRKTADYMEEIGQHFGNVERKGKLIIAKDPVTDGKADWFMDAKQEEPIRFQSGSPIGNNEQLHIAREYAQDRTRTTTKLYEEVVENSVSLRHVLEDIARKSGKPIADYENVYLAENQSHGMMTTELITFRDRRVQPLDDALRKLAKHYGGEPTKNYVWARHGIERSIYVCFRERAYELAEKEAEAAAKARGEEVTDKDINDAYNAMLDELYNATSGYSRRAYLENLETECSNILSAHGNTKPFEVTDKAGLTALNDKRSLVDDNPIENAWEIVKEYESNAGTEGEADVEALFDRLNDISKSMLDYSRDKGMMDKDTVEKIRKMFRFYVPLQGFAEGTMAQDYFEYVDSNPMRAGRAVPNTPKMRGRGSESADPIATLVRNAEMTIAAARRNTVATHLYNLATSRDTDLFAPARAWEAYDAAEDTWVPSTPDFTGCETTKDMMDAIRLHDEQMRQQRELGLAREARRGFSNRLVTAQGAPKGLKMSIRQRHEHAVPVRINGKENVVYVLSDPRIAQIVNGTDKGSVDKEHSKFFYQANRLKRIQSALFTSYNFAFWFANGFRDIQSAALRQAIMEGGSAAARTAAQGMKGDPLGIIPWEAMRLYSKAVKGTLDDSNKHERYFKEFFEHGGITGYAFADQVETIQNRVKKLLKNPRRSMRRLMFSVGELMEKAGGAFEIAPRFATYVASRDGGKSVMQSVADAKEATVNFDRRGARRTWTMRFLASFYAFLNPGIQGMQNRLHQVRTQPAKTTILHAMDFAMGYVWKGVAVALLAALGRKDDEYDTQLTDHDRRNNICIPVGDDDWIKLPINMEDRVIWGLGDAVRNKADFFEGNRYIGGKEKSEYDDDDGWWDYAKLISAWFPIDVGSENNFVMTSAQPWYDVYINHKDWRGEAVDWRNENNAQLPEYRRSNKYRTGKMWMDASKWWSEQGGGDEKRRADDEWHEVNPQHMQYICQSYLGGIGTTIGQVMSLAETAMSDEDDVKWNSYKFPIINRFWKGNFNEYSSSSDERKKQRIWQDWAAEIIRRDREYRKDGADKDGSENTLSERAREHYKENLLYLELAKEIDSLARKKSQAKSKATKKGEKLSKEEEQEFDKTFRESIPGFEEKFMKIDGERRVPKWRKHHDY